MRKCSYRKNAELIIGQKIGYWEVISEKLQIENTKQRESAYRCRCLCGIEKVVKAKLLHRNESLSCGCRWKHGGRRTKLYYVWTSMKDRCFREASSDYSRYGGRGITVCQKWLNFTTFREWAQSNGYAPKLQIDRRDNNGNYCPENCHFVTNAENSKNRLDTHYITAFGETKCLSDWWRDTRCVVTRKSLENRLSTGMLPEIALTKPPRKMKVSRT